LQPKSHGCTKHLPVIPLFIRVNGLRKRRASRANGKCRRRDRQVNDRRQVHEREAGLRWDVSPIPERLCAPSSARHKLRPICARASALRSGARGALRSGIQVAAQPMPQKRVGRRCKGFGAGLETRRRLNLCRRPHSPCAERCRRHPPNPA
jgi:hypothetical protein